MTTKKAVKQAVQNFNNVVVRIEGTKLIAEIDLTKSVGMSGSGKNLNIGTTSGNRVIDVGGGKTVVIGVNCYTRPDPNKMFA